MKQEHKKAIAVLNEVIGDIKDQTCDARGSFESWNLIKKRLLDQEKLIDLTLCMRTAQRDFFDTRSKQSLFQSKDLERKCDLLLGDLVLNKQGRLL